jgi:uncharacterized membrane protein (Fun14 family)
MARAKGKNANNSFLLLLGLVAVFMLSLYMLNQSGVFNIGSRAGYNRRYPKVTLPPSAVDAVLRMTPNPNIVVPPPVN